MLVTYWLEGQVVKVLWHIVRHLITTGVETLGEVAVAIEKTHGGEPDVAIARLLDIVTCEDA